MKKELIASKKIEGEQQVPVVRYLNRTKSYSFSVPGVVARAVHDLEDDGGHQDDEDQDGSHEPPGDLPVQADLDAGHVLDVLRSKKIIYSCY